MAISFQDPGAYYERQQQRKDDQMRNLLNMMMMAKQFKEQRGQQQWQRGFKERQQTGVEQARVSNTEYKEALKERHEALTQRGIARDIESKRQFGIEQKQRKEQAAATLQYRRDVLTAQRATKKTDVIRKGDESSAKSAVVGIGNEIKRHRKKLSVTKYDFSGGGLTSMMGQPVEDTKEINGLTKVFTIADGILGEATYRSLDDENRKILNIIRKNYRKKSLTRKNKEGKPVKSYLGEIINGTIYIGDGIYIEAIK